MLSLPGGTTQRMQIHVLITEPDPLLLETYERFLTQQGFALTTTTDGPECVRALRAHAPDVLLLETDLPDGWGPRLLDMMHADQLPTVPVVVLSRQDELDCTPPVCVSFNKPTSLSKIVQKIREIVGHNGANGSKASNGTLR